jgi:hypothetical protein
LERGRIVKKRWNRSEKQAWDRAHADVSEWKRLRETPGLAKAVHAMQLAHGFPLPSKELEKWMGEDEPFEYDADRDEVTWGPRAKRGLELHRQIGKLATQFGLRKEHIRSLTDWITEEREGPIVKSFGLPRVRITRMGDQQGVEIIITPEIDIDDPTVREYILQFQERFRETCPQPLQDGRKLDWHTVWEWGKRHPRVSRAEIADLLHRDRSYVSRKLAELDEETK